MKYEVIDNFLDKEYFDSLVTIITDKDKEGNSIMPWFYVRGVAYGSGKSRKEKDRRKEEMERRGEEDRFFYMVHLFYSNNVSRSSLYDKLVPLLQKLGARCLIRIKANLYPNTERLHEHPMHTDFPFPHSGAILSLNTCDGYTKLKDGTKIDSVANRILLFDPSEEHCSTTTTNDPARFNININHIQRQYKEHSETI
jgi:hypothetical protein